MNIKDFKWTEKRFGTRFANILKKLGGLSKDGTDGSIEYKDDEGNITKLVTDSNFSSLLAKNGLIEVKWQELKDKRDSGKLIPGSLYRITDYNCTTTQENTQSAGHQFDIVLLALSANKLAEEGWAMNHGGIDMFDDYDIYTITFNDGVSKQCYYKVISNPPNDAEHRIVDTETFLGFSIWHKPAQDGFVINTENKTATNAYISSTEFESYLQTQYSYNYFQTSNLSAWKVWYCLDNDKSRFAWADDSVDEGSPASIMAYSSKEGEFPLERDITQDVEGFYAWADNFVTYFTNTETPSTNDILYDGQQDETNLSILSYTPAHEGTNLPNGRGVIYRLIDEWNNDVPYDFKNIQKYMNMNEGSYAGSGSGNTWVYTFSLYDRDNELYLDGSLRLVEVVVDDTYVVARNNYIERFFGPMKQQIPCNLIVGHMSVQDEEGAIGINITIIKSYYAVVSTTFGNTIVIGGVANGTNISTTGVYIEGKKVLTEE